jgi:hypothetical protein
MENRSFETAFLQLWDSYRSATPVTRPDNPNKEAAI